MRPRAASRGTETGVRRAVRLPGRAARAARAAMARASGQGVARWWASGLPGASLRVGPVGGGTCSPGVRSEVRPGVGPGVRPVSRLSFTRASTSSTSVSSASSVSAPVRAERAVIRRPCRRCHPSRGRSAWRRLRPRRARRGRGQWPCGRPRRPPRGLPGLRGGVAHEEGGQRRPGPGHVVGGVAGEVEQDAGVDVEIDAQLVLDCGDPFIQHGSMLPDTCPGGGDVVPGVAVEGRDGVRDTGEVESGGEPAQGQPGEAVVRFRERGELAAQCGGAVGGHEGLVAAVGVGEQRSVGAAARRALSRRRTVSAVRNGRSAERTTTSRAVVGCSPAPSAASGPPPGGSSRAQVTGRAVGLGSATTTVVRASAQAASTRSSSARPPTRTPGLSAPPSRRAAPPASTTTSYTRSAPGAPTGSYEVTLRVCGPQRSQGTRGAPQSQSARGHHGTRGARGALSDAGWVWGASGAGVGVGRLGVLDGRT